MIPDKRLTLRGKNSDEFEKYQKRTPSSDEIRYVKEADKVYLSNAED
jgi:hypothetical protein